MLLEIPPNNIQRIHVITINTINFCFTSFAVEITVVSYSMSILY